MKLFDPLYSRDSRGNIVTWQISVVLNQDQTASINIFEGLLNGKLTPTTRTVKKGKNLGKMNETTPYEQAISQAESRVEKKLKQGYKSMQDLKINNLTELDAALPLNRTDANNLSKPMKAQPYFKDDNSIRIKFPCYAQPKLNGFRVFARLEKVLEGEGIFAQEVIKPIFTSKEGMRYTILEHIEPEIEPIINEVASILKVTPKDVVLDGEMYIHGAILSEISSAVRKRNHQTTTLKYHIFDIAVENVPQSKRLEILEKLQIQLNNIIIVPTIIVNSNEEAQDFCTDCITDDYEGAIFRDMKALYQFGKRPQTMVKLKRIQDKEFKIIDVVGGENSPELGIFVCVAENGETFKVTPEGTKERKAEYLAAKSKYINKLLTVKFYERTKTGVPFHAVGVDIRDYE